MDLTLLNKYLNKAQSSILSRGKSLFKNNQFYIVKEDEVSIHALVQSSTNTPYNVKITNPSKTLVLICGCPTEYEICKHQVAVLLYLIKKQENIAKDVTVSTITKSIDSKPVTKIPNPTEKKVVISHKDVKINYEPLSVPFILKHVNSQLIQKATMELYGNRYYLPCDTEILLKEKNKFEFKILNSNIDYTVTLELKDTVLHTSCNCREKNTILCSHKIMAIINLTNNFTNPNILTELASKEEIKEKILKEYGIQDNFDTYFDLNFDRENGEFITSHKVKGLIKIDNSENPLSKLFKSNINLFTPTLPKQTTQDISFAFFLGERGAYNLNPFSGDVLCGKSKPGKNSFDYLGSENERYNPSLFVRKSENQKKISQLFSILASFNPTTQFDFEQEDDKKSLTYTYIYTELSQIKPLLENEIIYHSTDYQYNRQAKKLQLAKLDYEISFEVDYEIPFFKLKMVHNFKNSQTIKTYLYTIVCDNELYFYKSYNDYSILNYFLDTPEIILHESSEDEFIQNYILPLSKSYPIVMKTTKIQIENALATGFKPVIYLGESGNFMLIQPAASYDQKEVELLSNETILITSDSKHIQYQRDIDSEKEIIDFLLAQHPTFKKQLSRGFFYVQFDEILKNDWYFTFFDALKNANIEVFGFEKIKAKKIFPYKATITTSIASGIDWFDVNISVSFGSQQISIKEIQKAIFRKEDYVKLDDGSLGVLPKEWLEKYTELLTTAEIDKKGHVKISKLHFSLIDELFNLIDHEEIAKEIFEKKKRLVSFEEIQKPALPALSTATLRPYQEAGYHWLSFLDSYKWGGCLADDMGLGKTVQMITFLQSVIEKKPTQCNLVIVPTSLLFNWEREIKKFAPEITYLINNGSNRLKEEKELKKFQLIITTYGLIANDIDILQKIKFHYVILDESQAIKNPDSLRYKSVCLLKSHNRMVMTGTPVENNTFDLYAQMSFVNPGLLGTMTHFKTHFSDPIDKYSDADAAATLRKLIKPFMLRRTKEQVATDLPDKTEDIIICEMGAEQRQIYDAMKSKFRDLIGGAIEKDGLSKSSFMVLEALLKLRQICNSPALLKDEKKKSYESIKIAELIRHITQKTGNHKILIFSQFVEMLSLVKKEIQKLKIKFEYLDGSVQANKREGIVKNFQENDEIRIFLISLKAGGVGLNLTEADYVYLIDPWWNPAVEAQAIDRTHRIGQTKKVFAYKMICKDTIEEKVLLLQEKKKKVASEIISTEQSFYKQLEKEDIMELFA